MNVPFLDLKVQYNSIKDEITGAIQDVFAKTAFTAGPFIVQFEKDFASYCNTNHAIGVGSGTEALWLALLSLGVGSGDEVITVPNTFIATAEAISYCGAEPVFVDVEEDTYNINPHLLEAAITQKTKAIIPVHMFGQTADMDLIMELAREHKMFVVEDASQAHGAEYKGRVAGSIGDMGCFSFYPSKNLGAYGEAGAVVTNNHVLAKKIRMLRDHGQSRKYFHDLVGWNGRMDGLQGAVLSVKLKYLNGWNEARRRNAKLYNGLLGTIDGIVIPLEFPSNKHVYHIYAIRVLHRNFLVKTLAEKDIHCGIHYPIPLHMQDAYKSMGLREGSFPVTEKVASEFLSLPMFPELSTEQIYYVAAEIKKLVKERPLG